MRVLQLEQFEPAFPVSSVDADETQRRFMTLFAGEGSITDRATFAKVHNYRGETYALKVLPPAKSGSAATAQTRHAAFDEEYRMQCAVSQLQGFPKVFGRGLIEGQPALVMEWIEGQTLHQTLGTCTERVPLEAIARLGIAVIELLESAECIGTGFVHRDLSPRNIMLRGNTQDCARQLHTGNFDLCLLDFGSAAYEDSDPTFTKRSGVLRFGTPDYAPPEMLTEDVVLEDTSRLSTTIDTYALCSILYELYSGTTPYQLVTHADKSPYRIKTELPQPHCTVREGDGGALAGIIEAGLSLEQRHRPTPAQLSVALDNWLKDPQAQAPGTLGQTPRKTRNMWQPDYFGRVVSRRKLVAVGIVGAAAIVSGALVGKRLLEQGGATFDEAAFPTTDVPYEGEPLFKVYDSEHPGWAFANAQGHIICKPNSSRECGPLREGVIACYADTARAYGFIVPDGSGSYAWRVLPRFARVGDFSEGFAAAKDLRTKLWGFIDTQGAWAIPPTFRAAGAFAHGSAGGQINQADALWGEIDADGQWIIEPQFAALGMRSAQGFAIAQADTGTWGVVDAAGTWTCKPTFRFMRRFEAGLAPARLDANSLWGFVDAQGNWALKKRFLDARPFSNGAAAVQDAKTQLWYFIGPNGKPLHNALPRFWKLGELENGLAPAQASAHDASVVVGEGETATRIDGAHMRYGYVDELGEWHMKRLVTLVDTAIGTPGI